MYSLKQLEKQQVGLRLHSYLVEALDEMTEAFAVNRSDIIVEAIKAYISEQKALMIYEGFELACTELHDAIEKDDVSHLQNLDALINELEDDKSS